MSIPKPSRASLNFEIRARIKLDRLLSSRLRHGLMGMGAEGKEWLESTAFSKIRPMKAEVCLWLKSEIAAVDAKLGAA